MFPQHVIHITWCIHTLITTSNMQKNNKKSETKNGCKSGVKINEIDYNTAQKLAKLGNMGQTPSNLIRKLVDHAHICDKWWIEGDEDEL